ncbi:phosphotransferase [Frondihabitans australicus]|uniref:phosphotransferase n=1 Tax=Frondihabitans australicus TaxID=386892 RepID=UPI000EB0A626|nr:phosphotransferase [Frondihabitans australicus]
MIGDEAPGDETLRAFGLDPGEAGLPVRLEGGRGLTWAAGAVILRPHDEPDEAIWKAETLERLPPGDGFTVPAPRRTVDGGWLADGWEAQARVAGAAAPSRVADVVAAGTAFHRALANVERPAFIARKTNRWSIADRLAWGDPEPPGAPAAALPDDPQLAALVGALEPLDLPSQVIHGDLLGNVLFAPGLPPAVIDWAPYWRPVGFGAAVAVADAVVWHGVGLQELAHDHGHTGWRQLLLRALVYRIATQHFAGRWDSRFAARHAPVVAAALALPR